MRAVNLLPEADRAKAAPAAATGSSRFVLGGLAVLVLAMLAVVVTQNQITSRRAEVTKLNGEQQAAAQRAAQLGSYGQFSQIKTTRVESITSLAKSRFDWERLMREVSLVLPDGTWISSLEATSSPSADSTSSAASSSTPTSDESGPSAQIEGCAKSQSRVAEAMVRLRGLYRAEDVDLTSSTGPNDAEGGAATAAAPAQGTESQGCGKYFTFNATVKFGDAGTERPKDNKSVPSRLGGGA